MSTVDFTVRSGGRLGGSSRFGLHRLRRGLRRRRVGYRTGGISRICGIYRATGFFSRFAFFNGLCAKMQADSNSKANQGGRDNA